MLLKSSEILNRLHPWLTNPSNCAESDLDRLARDCAACLQPGWWVSLEGPLGAGKTTFAQKLLTALQVTRPPQGSPTFSLTHLYTSPKGPLLHLDFYRLQSLAELEERGLAAFFLEAPQDWIFITEWASRFPAFQTRVSEQLQHLLHIQFDWSPLQQASERWVTVSLGDSTKLPNDSPTDQE